MWWPARPRRIDQLILRAYAQATASVARAAALDLIDELLFHGAYDFARTLDEAAR
jgi:hypothetical protein